MTFEPKNKSDDKTGETASGLFGLDASTNDLIWRFILGFFALIGASTVMFIILFLIIEAIPAIIHQGPGFIFDSRWDPYRDIYGIFIFITGTMWISTFAILFAVPLGVLAALFLSEYCPQRINRPIRIIIDLMASIPSIIYGLWAFRILVPILKDQWQPMLQDVFWWNPLFAGEPQGFGVLAASLILAVMLLPTVVAISEDAMNFVPNDLREASLALGASRTETAFKVVLSSALPGIGAAILLALGRAIGETMAVLMVTGNSLNIPDSLFSRVYALTSIIANQLGFAYNTPLYRSGLFAAALILLLMSLSFTIFAKLIIRWTIKRGGMVRK